MNDSIHDAVDDWDAAYVLGALSPDDRRRYEAHLAECATCAKAVGELAGLPGILGDLDRDEALALRDLPDDAGLRGGAHDVDRAGGIARRVARRRRTRLLAGAAAAAGVLAVGGIGWSVVGGGAPSTPLASAVEMQPVGDSHLFADLRVTSVGWGTRLDWSCDYRAPAGDVETSSTPVSYSLVVHTDSGASSTVATWSSDAGEAKGLVAATAIPADAIDRVDIRVTGTGTALAQTAF